MADYTTQICIVGAGPTGLAAAVQAAEDGADVLVIDKAAAVGGAANMGMGPLGIGTKYQKRDMQDITVEKAFDMIMTYTHYMVDARVVKRYFEQSAETIEWLEDMGVEFEGAFKYFPQAEPTWHIVKTDQGRRSDYGRDCDNEGWQGYYHRGKGCHRMHRRCRRQP